MSEQEERNSLRNQAIDAVRINSQQIFTPATNLIDEQKAKIAKLEEALKVSEEALKKYGRHPWECKYDPLSGLDVEEKYLKCVCGLREALAKIAELKGR